MRWAENLDVESVGVVPPIVEWRARQHGEGAPNRDPGAEGPAKSPQAHGGLSSGPAAKESALQNQPAADETTERSAYVNADVGGRPKRVASNGRVPRDVPNN